MRPQQMRITAAGIARKRQYFFLSPTVFYGRIYIITERFDVITQTSFHSTN